MVWTLSPDMEPAARVSAGSRVRFEVRDCYNGQIRSTQDLRDHIDRSRINPATGPVFVAGATPGSSLAVRVLEIQLAGSGMMPVSPGLGVLGDRIGSSTTRLLPLRDGVVLLPGGLRVRIQPMIGLVAVTPPDGPVTTSVPGDHGGNMDVRDVTEGTTVYLPVLVPGALLAVGDLHARMGDGEVGGTGVEVAGSVLVQVDVLPGLRIGSKVWKVNRPLVDTDEAIVFVGSGDSLQDAIRVATLDATSFINLALDVDFSDAYRLCSIAGNLQFGQVVNARPTVKVVIPKKELGIEP